MIKGLSVKAGLGLISLALLALSACRKDDICTADTTPKLHLAFYDTAQPDNPKNVADLSVIALPDNDTLSAHQSMADIGLPLNVNADHCVFILADQNNNDTLSFQYQRETVFVSKSCGYKMFFHQLHIDLQHDNDNWIQQIEVLKTDIVSDTIHIKIYH